MWILTKRFYHITQKIAIREMAQNPRFMGRFPANRRGKIRISGNRGVPGVDWRADKARWRASICFKGKRRCLGSYARFEDAVKARKQAEEAYFKTFLEECARAPRAAGGRPAP